MSGAGTRLDLRLTTERLGPVRIGRNRVCIGSEISGERRSPQGLRLVFSVVSLLAHFGYGSIFQIDDPGILAVQGDGGSIVTVKGNNKHMSAADESHGST